MYLTKISLAHFRNYTHFLFEPQPGVNIIIAGNAQGKSNLLEAIYFLTASRSYKMTKDQELIQWSFSESSVLAQITRRSRGEVLIEVKFGPQIDKIIRLNGVRKQKIGQLLGEVSVVLFTPDDLQIIKGDPQQRRRFLNLALSQLSRHYFFTLLQYNKVLLQRNKLLKEIREDKSKLKYLASWDEQIIAYGSRVLERRLEAIKDLYPIAQLMHKKLTAEKEDLSLKYVSSLPLTEPAEPKEIGRLFANKLESIKAEEIAKGMTLLGPHRDDISFLIGGADLRAFGSQGQQRTAAVSLKLAEFHLIKEKIKEPPILLLDDVLSELDEERQRGIFETFQDIDQIFITATSLTEIPRGLQDRAQKVKLQNGAITLME